MKLSLAAILAPAILSASCTIRLPAADCGDPATYYASPEFDEADLRSLEEAAAEMNAFVGRERFRIVRSETIPTKCGIRPAIEGTEDLGTFYGRTKSIDLEVNLPPEACDGVDREACFREVFKHELGHALGMGHVERGIMSTGAIGNDFSDEDRAECVRSGACD